MVFQNDTARQTGELAVNTAGLEDDLGIDGDRISDLFFAAEREMLAAVDSMSIGKFDSGVLQQKDALRHLVEARNRIEAEGPIGDGGLARQLFLLSRRMMQKLRLLETDAEKGQQIALALRSLANRQNTVVNTVEQQMQASSGVDASTTNADANRMNEDDLADEMARKQQQDLARAQNDIVMDVQDINRAVQGLESVTDLARDRAERALQSAEDVDQAMQQGESDRTTLSGRQASALFRHLAANIEGISKSEAAQRIALARDLATRISNDQRQLEGELKAIESARKQDDGDNSQEDGWEPSVLTERVSQQTQMAKTVQDILRATVSVFAAQQESAVARVERMVEELGVGDTIDGMDRLADLIESDQMAELRVNAGDVADRFEIVSQQLDAIFQDIVAPRAQRLRALKTRAVELHERLRVLDGDELITRWHRRASALLADLEQGRVAAEPSQ